MRLVQIITLVGLAACATTNAPTARWQGTAITKTEGTTCKASRATLNYNSDGTVIFVPDEGTWLLEGTVTSTGTITASAVRLGADKRPFVTRLDAILTEGTIKGRYSTPRCTYEVSLTPAAL